jgi:HAD superfamily phosphatase
VVRLAPKLVIFDVDGVLVDVHGSYHRSILDTVKHFTGRRFTYADIQQWKSRSGYNDDWRLSTDWINSLGKNVEYAQVKRAFQKIYW